MQVFRIKDGIDLAILRNYGFELGHVLAQNHPYDKIFDDCGYMLDWWHYMEIPKDEETGEFRVNYDTDEYCPQIHAWVDTTDNKNYLWFDATPECTYHISMDELNPVIKIVFDLTKVGIVEEIEVK